MAKGLLKKLAGVADEYAHVPDPRLDSALRRVQEQAQMSHDQLKPVAEGLARFHADQQMQQNVDRFGRQALDYMSPEHANRLIGTGLENDRTRLLQQLMGGQPGSASTQRSNTAGSYQKALNMLTGGDPAAAGRVLDYGAGQGKGAQAMRDLGASVDTLEPFPQGWNPNFTDAGQVPGGYDTVMNMNVLNVLEPELRERVARDLLSKINPGGQAFIGTRGYTGDIANTKNFTPADEPGAMWVEKSGQRSYQKGYDGDELVDYIQGLLPKNYSVEPANNITKRGAVVRRKKK